MTTNITGHWDSLVEGYDPVMSSDPAYLRLLSGVTALIPAHTMRILDLGCGTGALSFLCRRHLPNAEVVGLDPAPKMVAEADKRRRMDPNISFLQGSAADLSAFPAETFDAVVSNFALHHLTHPDKQRCAAEAFRVLKPGGRFINSDQHCKVMGETSNPERVLHILDLLTAKARFYFLNAGIDRMLLQLELLPRFIRQDGEILSTPEFWSDALGSSGFKNINIQVVEPAELMNRIVWGDKGR